LLARCESRDLSMFCFIVASFMSIELEFAKSLDSSVEVVSKPRDHASSSDFEVVEVTPQTTCARWRKLLHGMWRIRRLQRYFGQLGQHLQHNVSRSLADRLRKVYLKQ
jgi:hypothetical protein